MIRNISEWLMRAIDVWRADGFLTMVVRGFKLLRSWLFQWEEHYICEYVIGEMNETEFIPHIENVSVRIIHTLGDAEELFATTGFNLLRRFEGSRRRLEKGAVAFCLFVNGECAHVEWAALSDEAKRVVAALPYKVDFANNEACAGSAETKPKFRGKGLHKYGSYSRLKYLRGLGITIVRYSMEKNNIPTLKVHRRLGAKVYAEGHIFKLLSRRVYYKEIPASGKVKL